MKIQTLNLLALIALLCELHVSKIQRILPQVSYLQGESVSICAVTPELYQTTKTKAARLMKTSLMISPKLSVGGQACQMQQLFFVRGVDRFVLPQETGSRLGDCF